MTFRFKRNFFIDTNAALHWLRQNETGKLLEELYAISTPKERQKIYISRISVGEINAMSERHSWGVAKRALFKQFLGFLKIVDIDNDAITDAYGKIMAESEKRGVRSGQNDAWIAATVLVSKGVLLTADNDFDWMDGVFIDVLKF